MPQTVQTSMHLSKNISTWQNQQVVLVWCEANSVMVLRVKFEISLDDFTRFEHNTSTYRTAEKV